jgi:hypothetical protein
MVRREDRNPCSAATGPRDQCEENGPETAARPAGDAFVPRHVQNCHGYGAFAVFAAGIALTFSRDLLFDQKSVWESDECTP